MDKDTLDAALDAATEAHGRFVTAGGGEVRLPLVRHEEEGYLPDGDEDRCVATTAQGRRCKNPVLEGQAHWYTEADRLAEETDHPTCTMRQVEYQIMKSRLCRVHR